MGRMKSSGSLRHQELVEALEALKDIVQVVITWHQSMIASIEKACKQFERTTRAPLLSGPSTNPVKLNVTSAKGTSRALYLLGRDTDEEALEASTEDSYSQVPWLREPEVRLLVEEIHELVMLSLKAASKDDAIEYLLAARALFRRVNKLLKGSRSKILHSS